MKTQRDNNWLEAIKVYIPAIEYMTFSNPKTTMKWVFDRIGYTPKSSFWPKVDFPAKENAKQDEKKVEDLK